jgi:hypothetical protein
LLSDRNSSFFAALGMQILGDLALYLSSSNIYAAGPGDFSRSTDSFGALEKLAGPEILLNSEKLFISKYDLL